MSQYTGIYLKNIYKTDLCDCLKRIAKETHLYSRWLITGGNGLYPGGLISGIIYSLANGWAYIRGAQSRGRELKWDFTV